MTDAQPAQNSSVDAIAEAYVDAVAAIDPYEATYVGIAGHDGETTDLSPDGFAERAFLARRTLAQLDTATARDERERVAGEAMRERLGLQLEMHEAGLDRALNNIASPVHWVREVFDLMPTETEAHWANFDARLRAVPDALAGYRRTLEADIGAGLPPAARQVAEVAIQTRRAADGFFSSLVESAPEAMRDTLLDAAGIATAAFADFADYLAREVAAKARTHDPVGRDVYQVASRYFLGAQVDLDETYAWGLEEFDRIEREMTAVAAAISAGGSIEDAIAVLDADPARTVADVEALRIWMQDLSDRTIASLADRHFDIPEPIRTLECRIAPTHDGVMYYTGPSEDFSRPGRMWWSVPEGLDKLTTWRETTTVFHEGVPGHHLQVAQAVHQREVLNRWQRTMCWVSGHGEGWALYAERLMDELGYLDDLGDRLGFLDAQALRAARVIVDLGLHLELEIPDALVRRDGLPAGRWTPEAAFEFMRKHIRQDEKILEFELNRYLGWPGQAPSYKIGERIWLEAREDAQRRKGPAFDLKEFHRAALDLGALGLDPLKAALARL
ncbi:MAG TPA: DUF885 domain-containing protein [Jiangellaceae bacterium]